METCMGICTPWPIWACSFHLVGWASSSLRWPSWLPIITTPAGWATHQWVATVCRQSRQGPMLAPPLSYPFSESILDIIMYALTEKGMQVTIWWAGLLHLFVGPPSYLSSPAPQAAALCLKTPQRLASTQRHPCVLASGLAAAPMQLPAAVAHQTRNVTAATMKYCMENLQTTSSQAQQLQPMPAWLHLQLISAAAILRVLLFDNRKQQV